MILMNSCLNILIHYPFFIKWHGPVFITSTFPLEKSMSMFMKTITGKCLLGIAVRQRLLFAKRIDGTYKKSFGIGNNTFVYH